MSDFLQRESDLLGGEFSTVGAGGGGDDDDFDFDRAASAFPDISLDGGVPEAPAAAAGRSTSGYSLDAFSTPQPAVKVTGDDDLDKFENEYPDLGPAQPATFSTPTFAPKPQNSFSTTPILAQAAVEDDPPVIKEWREKQQAEIEKREQAAKLRRENTIGAAESSIEEFYENYAQKKERNIRGNKNAEAEYLQELTNSLSQGTTWERICNLIDLQNSQSKTLARAGPDTTDLSRFKEILLRLKRDGDTAPGAAGY